jgi:hypothetical protein
MCARERDVKRTLGCAYFIDTARLIAIEQRPVAHIDTPTIQRNRLGTLDGAKQLREARRARRCGIVEIKVEPAERLRQIVASAERENGDGRLACCELCAHAFDARQQPVDGAVAAAHQQPEIGDALEAQQSLFWRMFGINQPNLITI